MNRWYETYATWQGFAIFRHTARRGVVRALFVAEYADQPTALAVCRDPNRKRSR